MSSKSRILVGVFLVGGILLFAAGLFIIGSRKQIFGSHYDVYANFDKIDTLTPGAKVRVSGMDAGEVSDINVPSRPSGRFHLRLHIDEKFRPIVRDDSTASIETEGMVGNKYVDIAKGGDHSPDCPAGCTLPTREPVELGDLMRQGKGIAQSVQNTIDDLHHRSDTAIHHVTSLIEHADQTVTASRGDIKAITSNGAQITQKADGLITSIRQGHGVAGKILSDQAAASDVSATLDNAKAASAQARQATEKVNAMTAELHQAVNNFLKPPGQEEKTTEALRKTIDDAQQAAVNVQDDSEALKHNFFLRGFFKRRGFFDMQELTPEKYASTEFVKKPRVRVWIPAAGLFTAQSDGSLQLSQDGQAIIRQDMSRIVPYLPHNPIMVEGYSEHGAADQRYLTSRQRADQVRDFIESNFHVDPKFVGAMPLRDRPPHGAGRTTWDGICLVVVQAR